MSKRVAKLERGLDRLTGEKPLRIKRMSRRKKVALLVIMWLTPGLPPPGPFG
jgi:hypothetical protein